MRKSAKLLFGMGLAAVSFGMASEVNGASRYVEATANVNMRTGPSTSDSIIVTIKKGTKIELIEYQGSWAKVSYNGKIGYSSKDYLREVSGDISSPDSNTKTMEVTTSSLNVRSGPGTSYRVVGGLSKGAKVDVYEIKNGWAKIKYNNGVAYVSAEYLSEIGTIAPPTVNPELPQNTEVMEVNTASLNVRSGAGTSYSIVGKLSKGTKVDVYEIKSGWAKINYNNSVAYVSAEYLSEIGTTTPPTTDLDNNSGTQKPLPIPTSTPTYVDSPQNSGVIDSSQDKYQSKIKVSKTKGTTLTGISIDTDKTFNIGYEVCIDGKWYGGSNGSKASYAGKSVEGIKIKLNNAPSDYHIFYRTNVKGQGWQAWVKDNTISGEIGNGTVVEDIEVRLVVSNNTNSMVKPTIAVDIGHNVPRPVVFGAVNGVYDEDYLTKVIGEKVIYKLRSKGYNVVNTLPKGRYSQSNELRERVSIANLNKANKFVSIHFNSSATVGANGSEVLYYRSDSKDMANKILNNIVSDFGFKNRGIKYRDNIYVVKNTTMPSVLVEGCFLDNIDMNKFIAKGSAAYDIMADAIVRGIIN